MDLYENMKKKNIELPACPSAGGRYALTVVSGNQIYVSGQTPKRNGALLKKGKLGKEISSEEGYDLARVCTLNALAAIESRLGSLNRISRVVKITVFVNSSPEFTEQAYVANGATDLLADIFGEDHLPARSAVGMACLPGNAPCEVEVTAEMREESCE